MNTFPAGTRVKITEAYGKNWHESDGSMEALHGTEGTVTPHGGEYIEVKLDAKAGTHHSAYLFTREELEVV